MSAAGGQNRMELRTRVDDARQQATIELWMDGKPLGHIVLEAAELEGYIHQLGQHRAAMAEEAPRELDIGARLATVVDPIWRVPGERQAEGRLMALRHPGFGWLGFLLPEKETKALAEWLSKDLPVKKTSTKQE